MKIREVYRKLNEKIPPVLSCDWDNDGLMVEADAEREICHALVALEASADAVDYAVREGFDLIVTHHPLIFHPLKKLTEDRYAAKCALRCIKNGVSVMSFHTRLDAVDGGVNDALAAALGLTSVERLPELGRIGSLAQAMSIEEFAHHVCASLGCNNVNFVGEKNVKRVAVVGGDGKDLYEIARASGADTYVTGAMSYNMMVEADADGMNVVEAGHFYTEQPVCTVLAQLLTDLGIESEIYFSNPIGVCRCNIFSE